MKRKIVVLQIFAFFLVLFPLVSTAALHTEIVQYKHDNVILEGYVAYDDSFKGKRPGVLVVHEWTGLGDYIKRRAEQLAGLGYVAFGADIYGKGIRPENAEEAGKEAAIYRNNRQLLRERVQAGLKELRNHSLTDTKRIAAIGYCFGGGAVLELARSGAEVSGVVSFHGNLDNPTPADVKKVRTKVLVLHGAEDPVVPPEQVQAFQKEMNEADIDWYLVSYGNALHSFTNRESGNDPSKGVAYNERADKRSWEAMLSFFKEIFKQ